MKVAFPDDHRAAAMRAAFFADLEQRLADLASIGGRLEAGELSENEARRAILAHLHDIKGCGTPYGVTQATELARAYERELSPGAATAALLAERLDSLLNSFRDLMP